MLTALLAQTACSATVGGSEDNAAPVVALSGVEEGSPRAGQPLTFLATVEDDRPVDELTLAWADDGTPLEGVGTVGGSEARMRLQDGLDAGDHAITLEATDRDGAAGTASTTVRIGPNAPPSAAFEAPEAGSVHAEGLPLVVSVEVEDPDDDLADLALAWSGTAMAHAAGPDRVDAGGLAIFTIEFVDVGEHDLRVTATDPADNAASASVRFDVVDGDLDDDGAIAERYGGTDCDDTDARVHPDAEEVCGNRVDEDCDGTADRC